MPKIPAYKLESSFHLQIQNWKLFKIGWVRHRFCVLMDQGEACGHHVSENSSSSCHTSDSTTSYTHNPYGSDGMVHLPAGTGRLFALRWRLDDTLSAPPSLESWGISYAIGLLTMKWYQSFWMRDAIFFKRKRWAWTAELRFLSHFFFRAFFV